MDKFFPFLMPCPGDSPHLRPSATRSHLLSAMEDAGRLVDDPLLKKRNGRRAWHPQHGRTSLKSSSKNAYIERDGRSWFPTPKGRELIGWFPQPEERRPHRRMGIAPLKIARDRRGRTVPFRPQGNARFLSKK